MSFWTDSKVVDDFTPEDRYVYLYLFTNPHTNLCGCYEISLKQISIETGLSVEKVDALLLKFSEVHNIIRYSKKTKEILLLNWHKYNWTSSEKFRKPLLKEISEVKEESFKDYLQRLADGEDPVYGIDINCSDTNCIDTSVTVTVTDTVTVSDTNTDSSAKGKRQKKKGYSEEFERFWSAYPRKEDKWNAYKSFNKAVDDGTMNLDMAIASIEMYKRTEQWRKEGGKYIPLPKTWLNGKRWEDSPNVDLTNADRSEGKWERAAKRLVEQQEGVDIA